MAVIRFRRDLTNRVYTGGLCPVYSGIAVVECPPHCRTIAINTYEERNNHPPLRILRNTYYLAFPWTVFVVFFCRNKFTYTCSKVSVGFRNATLTDTDQVLYFPHLYNIYPLNLKICMEVQSETAEANQLFIEAINSFWNSPFQFSPTIDRLYCQYNAYCKDKRVATYDEWARMTQVDPDFITDVAWVRRAELSTIMGLEGV